MENSPYLSGDEIRKLVIEKIDSYENLGVLEQYAMFMGKAQILEFGLKGLLARKYGILFDSLEKWTLGRVKNELKKRSLRPDFITVLDRIVDHRNYIAHEFLINNAITKNLANFSDHKLYSDLFHAIYELEQIIILYDWCEEHDGWQ